jgi:hypothetical protein
VERNDDDMVLHCYFLGSARLPAYCIGAAKGRHIASEAWLGSARCRLSLRLLSSFHHVEAGRSRHVLRPLPPRLLLDVVYSRWSINAKPAHV